MEIKPPEACTKEEMSQANMDIKRARILAVQVVELLYAQEETTQQKIIAAGIVFGSMAALHGLQISDAKVLLEGCYALAEDFFDAAGPMQ